MPRTKLGRNGGKRNRKSSTNDRVEMQLKDLESMAEAYYCDLAVKCMQFQDDIGELIDMMRKKTPKNILKMTYGELKALEIKNFADLTLAHDTNGTVSSVTSTMSIIMEKTVVTKKFSHDEGYLSTEDSNRMSADNHMPPSSVLRPGRVLGPLASAQARRRSKSADATYATGTPCPSIMSSALGNKPKAKAQTPLVQQKKSLGEKTTHASRTKYRTPIVKQIKSASADRIGTITPKVQPYHPMAMLRHAKAGEAIFSISGSPVVTSSITEETANVNIPLHNGILSIRPTEMQSVDSKFVSGLNMTTISQLQMLKNNIDVILRAKNY